MLLQQMWIGAEAIGPKEFKFLAGASTSGLLICQNWLLKWSKIVQSDQIYLELVPVNENKHVWIVHPRNLHRNLIFQPDLVDLLQKNAVEIDNEKELVIFYLVLFLVQEERVTTLQSLEIFFMFPFYFYPLAYITLHCMY